MIKSRLITYNFLSILWVFMTGCTPLSYDKPQPHLSHSSRIQNAFIQEMEKEGLRCWAAGGALMTCIKKLDANFTLPLQANEDEARELILSILDRLLAMVNEDEEARPYLIQYPFTSQNITTSFSFTDARGSRIRGEGVLCSARSILGTVVFADHGPKQCKILREETQEEARAKVPHIRPVGEIITAIRKRMEAELNTEMQSKENDDE